MERFQSATEPRDVPSGLGKLNRQKVRRCRFGARLGGISPLSAPLSRCRGQSVRVDEYKPSRRRIAPIPPLPVALSTFGQNAQLRLRRKRPASRPVRQFGRWRGRRRYRGHGPILRLLPFALHDHDDCPLPSRLNFKDSDVSPSLARRVRTSASRVKFLNGSSVRATSRASSLKPSASKQDAHLSGQRTQQSQPEARASAKLHRRPALSDQQHILLNRPGFAGGSNS